MLVGRDQARRDLDALVAGARLGQSGVLVVRGEAGLGKSALLDDAVSRTSGVRLLRAQGTEAERELPFAGLATVLRPVVDLVDTLPAPQAEALGVALALRSGDAADRFAISAGVLTLLTRAADAHPTAVVVDDGHLLDRPSADALAFVARRLVADPLLVLVALRPDETDAWDGLPVLDLVRLDDELSRELVRSSNASLTDDQVGRIVELAAGNPLVLRTLADSPDAAPESLSSIASAVFGMRVDRLPPALAGAVRVAAVAGEDAGLVRRACASAGIPVEGLTAAEEAGLLRNDPDRVAFVHPLAQAAVHAATPAAERRRLHLLVAATLPPGDADRRAWHLSAAALGPDESVATELDAVAGRATARGAHAVAASASERAARLSASSDDAGRRLLAAGEAAWLSGDDGRASTVLTEAGLHVTDPELRARVRAVTGLAAARRGRLAEAYTELLGAAGEAGAGAIGEALVLHAEVVEVCFYLLDVPAATAAADRLETLLTDPTIGTRADGRSRAIASIAVGIARTLDGGSGVEHLRRGVDLLAGLPPDQPRARSAWEVLGPLYLREAGVGRDLVQRSVSERRAAGALGELPHLLFHLARDDATGDRWARAEAEYGEAVALARETRQATELAASLAGLCWVHGRQGRADECRAAATEARALVEAHDIHLVTAWVAFALAELDLSQGAIADAVAGFESLATLLTDRGVGDPDLSPVPELVEARLRQGDGAASDALVADYLARAEGKGSPWSLARAARVRALLAADADVDAAFVTALDQHALTPDRFEVARTRLLYGERLRRMRRRTDCRVHLRAALDDFERLGARRWSEVASAELAASGLTVRRRETGPVIDLTARELQIALLLADGQTTREAAAALFLSPKTVEYHLRHVYTKLGIASRTELAERVRDLA